MLDILILTHNHEAYIKKCLHSIQEQECTYPFKIVVLDDHSHDKTFSIIDKIQKESSLEIEIVRNEQNLGVLKSARKLVEYATSKYTIFMDGDDYWCYKKKLQKQLDFLENNPDYAGCFHDAHIKHHSHIKDDEYIKRTQQNWHTYSQFNSYNNTFKPWHLLQRNIIPTASLVFRNTETVKTYIKTYQYQPLSFSWAIHLEILKLSKFRYFHKTWSIYNDHDKGYSKKYSIPEFKQNNIRILKSLLEDPRWDYYYYQIYASMCHEYRMMLLSCDRQICSHKEFKKLLNAYKKLLKKHAKEDMKRLEYDFLHND